MVSVVNPALYSFLFKVKDSNGSLNATSTNIYVQGGQTAPDVRNVGRGGFGQRIPFGDIKLVLDKDEYNVGDDATVLIKV